MILPFSFDFRKGIATRDVVARPIRFRCASVVAASAALALLSVGAICRPVRAADNTADAATRPVLRVETGMHTARITTLAASGDLLVTGSLDKTVRVWRREPSGDLTALGVLRPPLRPGQYDGMIFAAAISPDRRTVACGGWTGKDGSGFSVYLFDRASGVLRRRLAGLPEIVTALAFSPDGTRLAVGVGGGRGGLHVFALADGKEIASDDYKLPCNSVDFAPDGRLVATAGSPVLGGGFVRLYDAARTHVTATQMSDKTATPQTARFSPDGAKIAVGYARPLRVEIYDASSLATHIGLSMGATADAAGGTLPFVCWSSDGDTLAAAGTLRSGERFVVRRWRHVLAGSPASEDTPVADDLVGALAASPDGSILFASADPMIGSVAPDGTARVGAACPIAREGGMGSDLRLSRSGATIGFSFQPFGREPAFFRIGDPEIAQGATGVAAANASAHPAVGDTRLTGWTPGGDGAQSPKLNGKPLALQQGEALATVAPSADGNLVLGTNFHLVAYGANGKERWRIVAPAETRIACVSPSGSVVAAAFADGTIRWYRMSDGGELLDFFAHTDRRRWVLWTPSGYYSCSAGGEDLIGWHLNRGADQAADFFPASRFHQLSYRPDVIQLVLDTLDESAARRLADQAIEQQRARTLSAMVLSRPAAAPEPIDLAQLFPSGAAAPLASKQGPAAVGGEGGPATLSQSNNGAMVIGAPGIDVNTTGTVASGPAVLQSPSGQPGKIIPAVPKTVPTPLTPPVPLTGPDVVPVASRGGQSPLTPSHSAPTTTVVPTATLPQRTNVTPSGSAVTVTDPTLRAIPNVSSNTSTHALPVVHEAPIAIEEVLPPVVRILSPRDDASLKGDATIVRIAVRTPANAPITDVKVLIDGRPATLARGLNFSGAEEGGGGTGLTGRDEAPTTADEQTRDLPIVLPNHNCEISVIVINRNAASVAAVVRVLRQSQAPAATMGKLYVLAVGVSKYANLPANMRLAYPAIDAKAFADAVSKQKGAMYQDVEVKVLTDEQATREQIDNGLEWLEKNTTSTDAAMVFFSGHGANNETNPKKPVYNFLPYNFDIKQWKSTGVSSSDIEETLSAIQGRVMLFLDTCDSGNVDISSVVNSLAAEQHGVAVFCASGRSQQALENSAWGNGAFTKAVVEALTATPDASIPLSEGPEARMALIRKLKTLTFEDLQGYVHDRVQELTGQKQEPVYSFPSLGGSHMIAQLPGS